MNDTFTLWLLNRAEQRHGLLRDATDRRQRRQALAQRVADCTEDGKIAVIESGRDCDGTQYWGHRHIIDANMTALNALRDRIAKWADGSFSLQLARPSEPVDAGSRDLTLEAFENGHPHHLIEADHEYTK